MTDEAKPEAVEGTERPRKKRKRKAKQAASTGDKPRAASSRKRLVPNTFEAPARRPLAPLLVGLSAASAILGLAISGTGPSETGRMLFIGGLLGLVLGIHRLGRLGPDGPQTTR